MGPAPEIYATGWINSESINISNQRGKVVLIDFWTYSCINCIRTLPYLKAWHEKYSAKGLVIIGVHTPEFEFEKDYNNVKSAVEKYELRYPIAQDNDYETWRAFGNRYWPRKYLIDKEGNIRYDHIGEGAYDETEKAIQSLLGVSMETENISAAATEVGTPELYLGYNYARQPLGNPEGFQPGNTVNYRFTNITQANTIYLSGLWRNEPDSMIAQGPSRLFLVYRAKSVNIVAGGNSNIEVFVDNEPANGADIKDGRGEIREHRLYNIVEGRGGVHLLEIAAELDFELYTFTFG